MSIGIWQVVLILLVVVIIFGAGKLPRVMGDLAKGIRNFKEGMREPEDTGATTAAGTAKPVESKVEVKTDKDSVNKV